MSVQPEAPRHLTRLAKILLGALMLIAAIAYGIYLFLLTVCRGGGR